LYKSSIFDLRFLSENPMERLVTTVPGSTEYPASVNPTGASDTGQRSQPVAETARPAEEPSDRTIEATALAGSAAIRRIIAERNELRRERERLLALNEELRRQNEITAERNELRLERERLLGLNEELRGQNEKMSTLRDRYKQLAAELVVHLRQTGLTMQEVSRKAQDLPEDIEHAVSADPEKEKDPVLEEIARRFSPMGKAG
jgi:chromosome segregation ATPase